MTVSQKVKSLEPSIYSDKNILLEQVTACPICKASIKPVTLNSVFYVAEGIVFIESHEFCTNCNHSFMSSHQVKMPSSGSIFETAALKSVEPQKYSETYFDKNINNLSPQFVKIFNQASAAEAYGLDEIAGLGYRKALEFLIKDFAIHQYPDSAEKIKAMYLGPCIKEFIDSPNIKTLASRSAWIGNDEAHYIRKQEDRDINDMKAFIQATVYFISMILITEDAASIESK